MSVLLLASSCASILNPKYQPVTIRTNKGSEVLINGEAPKSKGRYTYLLNRGDGKPVQITVKEEGYKDKNEVMMQYILSPLYALSWVPFAVLIIPPLLDKGSKSRNFDKAITLRQKVKDIPDRAENEREILVNKASIDINPEDIRFRYYVAYGQYMKNKNDVKFVKGSKSRSNDKKENIIVENTVFANLLNEVLKDKGYIDTSSRVLKNSYTNNLMVNANVTEYDITLVNNKPSIAFTGGMISIGLGIEWEILDYYENPIYSMETKETSDNFAINAYYSTDDAARNATYDAIYYGFINFINSKEVQKLLRDTTIMNEDNLLDSLTIEPASTYVSDLGNAITSSVTIKGKKGHGSGFIISENGLIVSNYHVISALKEDGKVVLNDKKEFNYEVIRVSKTTDLALIKIDTVGLMPFKVYTGRDITIAEDVFAVGTPTAEDLSQTVSKGIISGIRETDGKRQLIQTDASINSGNSGGALVNKEGVVLGIVSAKIKGIGVEGVAFGIPAYEIAESLKINF